MRSLLFVPADSEKKLLKGLESGADALIIDLEDSVAMANKPAGRALAAKFIAAHGQENPQVPALYLRINDLASGMSDDDLAAVMQAKPAGIMLPKSGGGDDVARLDARLRVHEAENGIADGATHIIPIITETPAAALNMASYSGSSKRLAGLTWGAEDLSAEIGAAQTRDETGRYTDVFRFARLSTILAATAAQVTPIDTVFPNFRDEEAFRRDCLEGVRDGFTARMAIHPAQIAIINETFTPSADAIAHARIVIDAFAAAGNVGVVGIDGKMFDRPHLKRAERLLARAQAAGVA